MKVCLDERSHGTDTLAYEGLAQFQGPSLLVFNDSTFKESDFESISRIGDSVKRTQVGKTGRFGVGFNSVYHLTDMPSFVSGRHAVFFDPHCAFLPNVTAANPGKRVDFVANDVFSRYPDQWAPFVALQSVVPETFDQIDANGGGFIVLTELCEWIEQGEKDAGTPTGALLGVGED